MAARVRLSPAASESAVSFGGVGGAGGQLTSKPHDWLMPDADLEAFHDSVRVGGSAFADGLVFDSQVYVPIDDGKPVLVSDSAASGMQRMAVVRDFLVPGDLL